MGKVDISIKLNRLYLRASGFFTEDEAKQAAAKIIAEVRKMSPGFDLVVDLRDFKPMSPKAADTLRDLLQTYKQHGVRRVVRVVGENVIGKMQMQRTAKEVGLD